MIAAVERKHALIKLDTGDWLLPSNDAQTVYRLTRYVDGPSQGLEDWPSDRTVWGVHRWNRPGRPTTLEDVDDWDRWDQIDSALDTRREAIEAALRLA